MAGFLANWPEKDRRLEIFCHDYKKSAFSAGQGGETCYHRNRWFGLFSVPAPPFRFTASGGVFIFLAASQHGIHSEALCFSPERNKFHFA